MLNMSFNPLFPQFAEKKELRYIVSNLDIFDYVKFQPTFTTLDCYIRCSKEDLPEQLDHILVPSKVRVRYTKSQEEVTRQIILTKSPVEKEELDEYNLTISKELFPYLFIRKDRLGEFNLPCFDKCPSIEFVSSFKYFTSEDQVLITGEFEYTSQDELIHLFEVLKNTPLIKHMCEKKSISMHIQSIIGYYLCSTI